MTIVDRVSLKYDRGRVKSVDNVQLCSCSCFNIKDWLALIQTPILSWRESGSSHLPDLRLLCLLNPCDAKYDPNISCSMDTCQTPSNSTSDPYLCCFSPQTSCFYLGQHWKIDQTRFDKTTIYPVLYIAIYEYEFCKYCTFGWLQHSTVLCAKKKNLSDKIFIDDIV